MSNQFSITSEDDDLFEVVVEGKGHAAQFEVPAGWRYDVQYVRDVVVQVMTPPRPDSGLSRTPVITFHDVAMNAPMCYSTFFNFCRTSGICPELDTAYAHYHLTAPGHLPDSPDIANATTFEVSELSKTVEEVIERFNLRRVIGFGFGLGATILTQAALAQPKRFSGLVMVSPVLFGASFMERTFTSVDAIYTKGVGLGRRTKDRFLDRWLSPNTRDFNHDLTNTIEAELDRLSASNLARFIAAEVTRPDLSGMLRELKAKVLLVTGRDSLLRFHTEDCFASFNPASVTWLDVMDMGSHVLEEKPDRVAKALSLYLQGFGEYTP